LGAPSIESVLPIVGLEGGDPIRQRTLIEGSAVSPVAQNGEVGERMGKFRGRLHAHQAAAQVLELPVGIECARRPGL
jgi:hypothetical protein